MSEPGPSGGHALVSNPADVISMIEVIAGKDTARSTVEWMCETIKGMSFLPVVVQKDVPGFVENSYPYALLRECVDLVENGVIDVDRASTPAFPGHRLQAVGDRADGVARHGGPRHLPGGRQLSEQGFVQPQRRGRICDGAHIHWKSLRMKSGGGIFSYTPEAGERAAR